MSYYGIFRLVFIILSISNIFIITSNNNVLSTDKNNLRFLSGSLICPSGSFGISWFSTYLTGKKLSKATDTNSICLVAETGIAKYEASYNILTCIFYHSGCGGEKTSDIKKYLCDYFSKYEQNTYGADRILFSKVQKPNENEIKEFDKSIGIIVADFGNSSKLKKFYESLPSECRKSLELSFDI